MAKKYEKNFVTQKESSSKYPSYLHIDPKTSRRVACFDDKNVKGCEFGCENIWLLPGEPKERNLIDANKQPYDRFIGFYSFNYDNIRDLCAEIEVYIGCEKHIINKSGAMFIPANIEVGPFIVRNITKPIFFTIEFPCGEGLKKKYI